MNGLQFAASLIASLAWPAVAIVLLVLIRRPLIRLLGELPASERMKRAKVGPVEVEWEALDQARAEVVTAAAEDGRVQSAPPTERVGELAELVSLAETHPTAAVILSFQRVEASLAEALARTGGIDQQGRVSAGRMIFAALQRGIISPHVASALDGLRILRNQVAHTADSGVTPGRAVEYLAIAEEAIGGLKTVLDSPRADADTDVTRVPA